ncbi:MAG: flavodoxin-dependent (E)-4-hydroxy-3-methylbut-2-enyl-diphosphate synthase [Chloroflexi bacterium]|nr:flavodoxin-dependent (E)-4-hydroxy-3-methylbut-2-enyl-diphosphate synthase [Chloroflexota bacterium]
MIARRVSKAIRIGSVTVGGNAPIVVQSMAKTTTHDVASTVKQIRELEEHGCEIVRVAVPDSKAARALPEIKRQIKIPLIADIHFHYKLALLALEGGVDGLRLNPGNIRDPENVKLIVKAAKKREVPIRVGVNFGSLPPKPYKDLGPNPTVVDRMVDAALWEIGILESLNFDLIKVSLKAFDVPTTVEAYQRIAQLVPYPLHIGITEAGTPKSGAVRSAVGIGVLLSMGIGDTIRVSLAGDPCEEVDVAYEILKSLNLRERGTTLIACPSCGRADVDIVSLANLVDSRLKGLKDTKVKVAVMGCEVNGPGEGRDADVGIAAGKGRAVIFRKGRKVRVVEEEDFLDALMEEVQKLKPDFQV